jgi:Cof subfamily protein (haloacid dehalogenase superfamily)
MVKLIALDLDGTLLSEGKYISKNNINAIKAARESGIEVVVATGRANFDAQSFFEELDIDPWIIGTNGATIHKPNGEFFHSVPLNKELAIDMLRTLEEESIYYEAFVQNNILAPSYGTETMLKEIEEAEKLGIETEIMRLEMKIQKEQKGHAVVPSYKDLMDDKIEIYNILAVSFLEDKLLKGWSNFTQIPNITIVKSGTYNFHLQHGEASKGNALKILANHLHIDLADTAAVGDNYNDLSMIEMSGFGAAMGNADDTIKEKSDMVTLSNDEDGVAHFIHTILNNKKSTAN